MGDDQDGGEGWGIGDGVGACGAEDMAGVGGVGGDVVAVFEGVVVGHGALLDGDGFFVVLVWEDGVAGGVDEEVCVEEGWEVFVGCGGDDVDACGGDEPAEGVGDRACGEAVEV